MMTTSLLKLETKYFVGSVIMSNRSRGFKFEYKTLNILKRNPNVIEALRSGGSHSLFDVIGFQANGIRLIQNKIDGYLKKEEREGLINFFKSLNYDFYKVVQFELWYYISKKKKKKAIIKPFGDYPIEKVIEKINSFNKKIKRGITEHI